MLKNEDDLIRTFKHVLRFITGYIILKILCILGRRKNLLSQYAEGIKMCEVDVD